jgi:hypothetical protein
MVVKQKERERCRGGVYPILIRLYPLNSLKTTEFQRSMLLMNSDSGQNSGKMDLNLCALDWPKLRKF